MEEEIASSEIQQYGTFQSQNEHEMRHRHVMSFLNGFKGEPNNSGSSSMMSDYSNQSDDNVDETGEIKRPLQTASEKKRRDMIKTGYDKLAQMCLRGCGQPENTSKMSHANILNRASNYIDSLETDIKNLREEKSQIERELMAAGTMKHICSSVITSKGEAPGVRTVSQVQAFAVFRDVMDNLYESFWQYVCMDNFPRLAETLLKWAELYCTPNFLHQFAESSLMRMRNAVASLFRAPVTC